MALAAAVSMLVMTLPAGAVAQDADPREGLAPGSDATSGGNAFTVPNADAATAASNMEFLANRPKPAWTNAAGQESAAAAFNYSNINSDLAFTGDHAISGNYRGFGIYDVSDPANPVLETIVNCVGGQGDVSVYGDLLFQSVESTSARLGCNNDASQPVFRGVRIFDISDLENPQYVAGVQTCRGSHTHTVVEDLNDDDTVYVYVSGTAGVRPATQLAGCTNPTNSNQASAYLDADGNPIATSRFQVEVIEVPLDAPEDAAIINEARLMADPVTGSPAGLWPGGNHGPGTQNTAATDACHDITAYPEIGLAAGACEGNGILIDISDPRNPVRIDEVLDPNFAYWHSATISNDGTKVVFTDEWGGGVGARCRPQDPDNWGANAIFDIVDGRLEFASYYKVPNVQADNETCVAHNGNLIPVPGRDIMAQAWYEGGVSVFDFTDSSNPVEIAFFDRGPYHPEVFHQGGYWSAYWYNGAIYGNEIFLGFDSFGLTPSEHLNEVEIAAAVSAELSEHNAQAQVEYTWPASFTTVRAWHSAAQRQDVLAAEIDANVAKFVDRAEAATQANNAAQRRNAAAQLRAVSNQLGDSSVEQGLRDALRELADTL
ncbi:LVIVD repeat-containing protein [Egicoccus sp. AB-alg2]|uniref:LVIVD repeat-containing protein n=1 Tax=Egicoccus sp. AB-alg2 TaxID=3242693 RepID=UPI00359D66C8